MIWGLVDDRTGHTGQVLGVITRLGRPYLLKRLDYNFLGKLPTKLQGASLRGLDAESRRTIAAPWPELVIAAGRRTLPTLRTIKRQSPSTRTVYLMWPEVKEGIDLIAVPEHDDPPRAEGIITTLAPLHAVTQDTLEAAQLAWAPRFSHLPRPYVAVSIGGPTKYGAYSPGDWRELMQRSVKLAGHGSLLITTSRRTPPEALTMIEPMLQLPHVLYRFAADKDNPYLGFLADADAVIVTGDSLSMCAEAAVAGKPLFIFANDAVAPPKHRRLHKALYSRGLAKPLDYNSALNWKPGAALDDVGTVVREIEKRFPEAVA